ncbi:MAG: Rpn family recombination-promoting nuclease/putative transposase [Prevotellaceae bacterium]|jgi:predicted transposase/invertase (TIGR01784 family)|nr:Rpn family recombination-promoting nuclease/putative transposase [Prevotellaceae bacterium]
MKYLDPKADLTFKKVFGEHPALLISFLNALLPMDADREIEEIEYLPFELVPDNPLHKDTIVDVRCRDKCGRQFLVEMQMIWTSDYKKRVLLNAAKAYSRQADAGDGYKLMQPVYSLNLINQVFEPALPSYYHQYQLRHTEYPDRIIEGLEIIFVELPKYNPLTFTEKKMKVLWLRYLTEINNRTEEVPADLLETPEIKEAVEIIQKSAFNEAELYAYERFWDYVWRERTLREGSKREGIKEGLEIGMKEGMKEGMKKGKYEEKQEVVLKAAAQGIPTATIALITGLSIEEIAHILAE